MAGAFTHVVVSDYAKADKTKLGEHLWQILNKHYSFLFLGSVSPDLPYLSIKTGSVNWADVMHYEKTNSNVIRGHQLLKESRNSWGEAEEAKFIWLLGYVSHLVTDATIHPIVQAIVGPYMQNKEEHRLCEMTEDPLLYTERKGDELDYAKMSDMFIFCKQSEHFNSFIEFWKKLLVDNYPEKQEDPDPGLWFVTYSDALDAAQEGGELAPLFRHAGITENIFYQKSVDIEKYFPQYMTKYYMQVKLPNGRFGFFEKEGYERAVANVTDAWIKLYKGLTTPLSVADVIRNWDLDTGVDMDSPNHTVTFWS